VKARGWYAGPPLGRSDGLNERVYELPARADIGVPVAERARTGGPVTSTVEEAVAAVAPSALSARVRLACRAPETPLAMSTVSPRGPSELPDEIGV